MFRALVDGLVIFKLNVVRVRVRVSTYLILIKSRENECVRVALSRLKALKEINKE